MDMNQANILVCDDEVEVADLLKHVLEREGFAVTCCHSGDAALTLLNAQVFDLAILDIMMPGIDGFEVCRQIRGGAAGSNTDMPIVFLSAKTEEFDKVLGFTLGADDYVTKPFSMPVLLRKIAAVLRRAGNGEVENSLLLYQDLILDLDAYRVTEGGQPVDLTSREFELLRELLQNQGRVLTRSVLLGKLWNYAFLGDERIVDSHIKNLRKKLKGDYIETVRGVGYRVEKVH